MFGLAFLVGLRDLLAVLFEVLEQDSFDVAGPSDTGEFRSRFSRDDLGDHSSRGLPEIGGSASLPESGRCAVN